MIKEISSNNPKFKTIVFDKGFNVILADRSNLSTDKDSRNGLGKSSIINIIHFLLGSQPGKDKGLRKLPLSKWTYKMIFTLNGFDYSVERNPEKHNEVILEGNFTNWPIQPKAEKNPNKFSLKNSEWASLLGNIIFDLPIAEKEKYHPSFRGLISFFARSGSDAFNDPFQHISKQLEWDKQVQNSFLLNLNYEYAIDLQKIKKDKEDILNQLKIASEQGLLGEFIGSIGDLEAERVRLAESVNKLEKELENFNVHPEYTEIQKEANLLTDQIQKDLNEKNISEQLLRKYNENLGEEKEVSLTSVQEIYSEVGILFPEKIVNTIDQISSFHKQVLENRKGYLTTEIIKLQRNIENYYQSIKVFSDKRKSLMVILQTHGALEEYFKLQQRLLEKKHLLEAIESKISTLQKFEEGKKSDLKIEKEDLLKKMRRDYIERKPIVDEAIKIFSKNSEFLYDEPGNLVIDVKDTGYKFRIDIKRSGSQGIDKMKVLCYDLTLSQLRSSASDRPGFLIHDSSIYDGVDERQISKGLERAYDLSQKSGFQYICTLNSDTIPYSDFSKEFTQIFDRSIRLNLDDSSDEGGLFGIRF